MSIQIIPYKNQPSTVWGGGKTTQLFIHPNDANYTSRNFKVRISSATIEASPSNFTSLPDYKRILMVLEGALEITHQEHHQIRLTPYQTDYFDGDWTTQSIGLGTDFNIIHSNHIKPDLIHRRLNESEQILISASEQTTVIFLHKGSGTLQEGNQLHQMNGLDTCICVASQGLSFIAHEPTDLLEIHLGELG